MNERIKVGFCVSYDWELLQRSLPLVYDHADVICLSLDKDRYTWSGKPFAFDAAAFYKWVAELDRQNKIQIYEDDFHRPELSSMENDNRQRLLMSQFLKPGGWHVQIDADEYFLGFRYFRDYLLQFNANPTGHEKPINISCNWVSLIKKIPEGYLYVNNRKNQYETVPVATNVPEYKQARVNSHFNHISPFFLLHETWARGEAQLAQKLDNWSHTADFSSRESYFNLWKVLDAHNYKYIHNFHPLNPPNWQRLGFVPKTEFDEMMYWFQHEANFKMDRSYLAVRNNRMVQRVKQRLHFK